MLSILISKSAIIITISIALLARNGYAGEDYLSTPLAELMQTKISIASKNEVSFLAAPASVSFFTAQDLNRLNVKHLSDLFEHIPGFYSAYNSQESNDSLLVTRGHAQKYANTVLFLFNGRRINDDYTGGINYLLRFINIAYVERVEVIRGPGSALYGSNAFNGVINIISKPNKHAAISVGSFDQYGGDLAWHHRWNDWQFGFSSAYTNDNGDTLEDVIDRFSLQESTQDPHEALQFEGFINYRNFSFRSLFIESQQQKFYVFRRLNDQYNRVHLRHTIHQFDYKITEQQNVKITISGQWQSAKRTSIGVLAPLGEAPFNEAPFLFGEYFQYQSQQLTLTGDYSITPEHTITGGIEWSNADIPQAALRSNFELFGDFEQLPKLTVFIDPEQRITLDKHRDISSAYLQVTSQLTPYWTITAGVRYDGYNDIDNKLNPRIAVVYQPDDAHVFKYIYGQAYRVPSLGDLYDEESGLVSGNQSLKPTTLTSTELTYNYIQSNTFWGFVLFENNIEDLIGFTNDDIRQLDNIAANSSHGLESEFKWEVNSQLQLSGHLTYLFRNRSTMQNHSDLTPSETLAPKRYGKISVQYQPSDQWSHHLHWLWRSSIDILTKNHAQSVVKYALDYQPSNNSQWRLAVANLFNTNHAHVSSTLLGERDSIPFQQMTARGRSFNLSFHYTF